MDTIENSGVKILDFNHLPSMSFTRPISFRFARHRSQDVESWRELYGEIVRHLFQKYPERVSDALSVDEIGDLKASKYMRTPFVVKRGVYIETGLSTETLVRRVRDLLEVCDMSSSELTISYSVDEEKKRNYNEKAELRRTESRVLQLNWDYIGSYKGSHPISLRYGKRRKIAVRNWPDLYVQVISALADEFPRVIRSGISFGDTRTDILKAGENTEAMQHPAHIGRNLVVETSGTSTQLVSRIYRAMSLCRVSPDSIIIQLEFDDPDMAMAYVGKKNSSKSEKLTDVSVDDRLVRRIRFLINKYFENGYRIDSTIDRSRLESFYEKRYHEAMVADEQEFSCALQKIANPVAGKIMPRTSAMLESLMKNIVREISDTFEDGATCIYTSELRKRYQQELETSGIHDDTTFENLLNDYTGNTYRLHYNRICFGRRKADVRQEIRQCLKAASEARTLDDISKGLWYIPPTVIEREAAAMEDVIAPAAKTYYLASCLPINHTCCIQIKDSVRSFFAIKPVMTEIELLDIVLQICPHLLSNVPFLTWKGLKESILYLLRDTIDTRDHQFVAK